MPYTKYLLCYLTYDRADYPQTVHTLTGSSQTSTPVKYGTAARVIPLYSYHCVPVGDANVSYSGNTTDVSQQWRNISDGTHNTFAATVLLFCHAGDL